MKFVIDVDIELERFDGRFLAIGAALGQTSEQPVGPRRRAPGQPVQDRARDVQVPREDGGGAARRPRRLRRRARHLPPAGRSDLGSSWADDGRVQNKQNSYDDLYAVAEHLVSTGLTTTEQLAVTGWSKRAGSWPGQR
jgi:hypothetical protein